jgi:hypothetical protein
MAEKKIEIKIAATGGSQAAAEVGKVGAAVEAVQKAASNNKGFGGMLDGSPERLDDVADAMENVAEKADEMEKALPDLTSFDFAAEGLEKLTGAAQTAAPAAAAASGGLGTLATVALRMVGGPLGVLTAAVGLAASAFRNWYDSIQATIAQLDKEEQIAREGAAAIRDAGVAAERTAEQKREAADRARDLADAIASIETSQSSYNDALEREIGLLLQKQKAENEIAKAKGDTELAAEDDPVKKEEIRQRLRKEAQDRELAGIEEEKRKRQDLLDRKEQDVPRVQTEGDNAAGAFRAKAAEAEASAENQREIARIAKMREEQFKSRMNNEDLPFEDRQAAARERFVTGNARQAAEDEAKRQEAAAKDFNDQADKIDAATKKVVDDITAEMQRLYEEIQKLQLEGATKREVFGERDKQGDIAVNRTRSQAEERAKAKADEEEKQRLQAELQTGESGLDANARERGLGLRGNRNDTVAAVGKALSDGTDAAELQKLGDMVRDAAGRNSAAMTQALLGLIGKLDQQERDLEVIRQKLKNK